MSIPPWLFRLAFGRRLPVVSGEVEAPGVMSPVTIRRDGYGVPYIEAGSDEDAWYGVGFCQGQDRAFQLEMLLRVSRGTVSELAGPAGLGVDRLARRIGFTEGAERQTGLLDADILANLEAFARGVNDGVRLGVRRRPHEFTLLRTQPTPYSLVDIVAAAKLQAFVLSSNWDIELARYHILLSDGPEALAALEPAYPVDHPVSAPPGAAQGVVADRLAEDLATLREATGYAGGSNNWALASSKTSTGRPILSNDPHLRPTLPPHWYLAQVRTPDWAAAGASFIGAPAIPAGHNGVAAWGVTAALVDTTDLFIEELGGDGRSVRDGDGFAPCEVRDEVIRVKGHDDVIERVVVTPRGPIVAEGPGGEALSLRAIWLDTLPVRGMLSIHKSRSFEEFRTNCGDWPLSSLNMVYADASGDIGWQIMGTVPVRKKGWGTIPAPGWDAEAGWEDEPAPHELVPHASNPQSGIVATANNSPTTGSGPYLGIDWLDGYRAARAYRALGERDDWDVPGTMALHLDVQSEPWREMRSAVLDVPAGDRDAQEALDLLESWDGRIAVDSPAATVFELFQAEMAQAIAKARAPRSAAWALGRASNAIVPYTLLAARRTGHTSRLIREQPDGWFEEGWPTAVSRALSATVRTLRDRYGEEHDAWAWGRARSLNLRHPAGDSRLLRGIFNRGPFPLGGDGNTISQGASSLDDPTAGPAAIPSLRMAIDVGGWENSRFSIPGGQSGNPASPHYDDILPMWLRGEGIPIAWEPESIRRLAVNELRLVPERRGKRRQTKHPGIEA